MSKSFPCQVVTPNEQLVDEPVAYASIPAHDSLFGVLPGRAPIVAQLGTGELRLEFPPDAGGSRSFFIDGGFAKMSGEGLTILAERAVPAEQLTESDAEAEVAAAEARQVSPDSSDPTADLEAIRAERTRARTKLRIARAQRGKGI